MFNDVLRPVGSIEHPRKAALVQLCATAEVNGISVLQNTVHSIQSYPLEQLVQKFCFVACVFACVLGDGRCTCYLAVGEVITKRQSPGFTRADSGISACRNPPKTASVFQADFSQVVAYA